MRKYIIAIFIAIFVFSIGIIKPMADDTYPYTYDVNSVSLETYNGQDCIKITGWFDFRRTTNINTKYSLQLVGYDASGKEYDGQIYSDVGGDETEHYEGAYDKPADYTIAWYTYYGGSTYPSSGSARADAIVKSWAQSAHDLCYFHINIGFTFYIPLSEFKTLANKNVTSVYFRLNASQKEQTGITVYGVYGFNTLYENTTVNLSLLEAAFSGDSNKNAVIDAIKDATGSTDVSIQNTQDSIKVLASEGFTQISPVFGNGHWYYSTSDYFGLSSNGSNAVYYSDSEYVTYGVKGSQNLKLLKSIYPDVKIYQTSIAADGQKINWYGTNYYRAYYASNGYTAYIPAFWIRPSTTPVYIKISPPVDCKTIPACGTKPTTACPSSCYSTYCYTNSPYINTDYCTINNPTPTTCTEETNKSATCSATGSTSVSFTYSKCNGAVQVFSNDLCTIKCSENLTANFNVAPYVKAGMGFEYPVAIVGKRTCTATYNNATWVSNMNSAIDSATSHYASYVSYTGQADAAKAACGDKVPQTCYSRSCASGSTILGHYYCWYYTSTPYDCSTCSKSGGSYSSAEYNWNSLYNSASTEYSAYTTQLGVIGSLNGSRNTCDQNWRSGNIYGAIPTITANISTSSTSTTFNYINTSNSLTANVANNNSTYSSNSLHDFSSSIFTTKPLTTPYYATWTETSNLNQKYEFNDYYYVEKYTGDLSTTGGSNYYGAGRLFFTDTTELTGKYNLDVTVRYAGQNVPNGNTNSVKKWRIDLDCWYNVDNKYTPTEPDHNYPVYGASAFYFRPISLTDPFPKGHKTGENWLTTDAIDYTKNMVLSGYNLYSAKAKYVYFLTPSIMKSIRESTTDASYGMYNSDYTAAFLKKYLSK